VPVLVLDPCYNSLGFNEKRALLDPLVAEEERKINLTPSR